MGMRLLLVTRLSNNYSFTKELSSYNKVWWGVAGSYIGLIFLCCLINMCINPGGDEMYDFYMNDGARVAFTKIFQISVFLIDMVGTIILFMGVKWLNVHRTTRIMPKGGCFAGLFIYFGVI
jgi:hypothetical protein